MMKLAEDLRKLGKFLVGGGVENIPFPAFDIHFENEIGAFVRKCLTRSGKDAVLSLGSSVIILR